MIRYAFIPNRDDWRHCQIIQAGDPLFTPPEINKQLGKSIPKILKLDFEPLKLLEILIQIIDVSKNQNQKSKDGEFL